MRTKAIISGAIAAIGLATLTANAGTNTPTSSRASVVNLVAGVRTIAKVDRDEVALGTRSAATVPASATPAARPVAAVRPAAPRLALSAGCQAAINTLKALHQADVAEDAAERAAQQPVSVAALQADRAEDLPAVDHQELERCENIIEPAIEKAIEQSAKVIKVRYHDDLGPLGGVGAVLRY